MNGDIERKAFHDGSRYMAARETEAMFAYQDPADTKDHLLESLNKKSAIGAIPHDVYHRRTQTIERGRLENSRLDAELARQPWLKSGDKYRIKTGRLRFKAGPADGDTFTLIAAAYGNVDRQDEVCVPGCVKNLDAFVREGVIILGHDLCQLPIAVPLSANQTESGFEITAKWHSTLAAIEARTTVKERFAAGKTVSCSIGFMVNECHYENVGGKSVRFLTSIDVWEVSIVNLPANPMARVIAA
jgi:HK97 family phage prohead protease